MISALGIGDNTVDRYVDQGLMYPGGNAVNFAVHAKRLGHPSAYMGCMGNDRKGDLIYNALVDEGVDVSRCRRKDGENAYCDIDLVDGDRVFGNYSTGVCEKLTITPEDLAFVSTFDLVHTSVYSFLDADLPALNAHANLLSYDFSSEWDRAFLENILPMLDIALLSNPVEKIQENIELLEWSGSLGPKVVMTTSGAQGAAVWIEGEIYTQHVIPLETVVDTLGAGDAFFTRFLTAYLEGAQISDALKQAAAYAAKSCGHFGAFGHATTI